MFRISAKLLATRSLKGLILLSAAVSLAMHFSSESLIVDSISTDASQAGEWLDPNEEHQVVPASVQALGPLSGGAPSYSAFCPFCIAPLLAPLLPPPKSF